MSAPPHANAQVDSGPSTMELDETREALAIAREWLVHKLEDGRVRDEKKDKVRIDSARALAYVSNTELKIREAVQLDDLQADVEALKEDRDTEP